MCNMKVKKVKEADDVAKYGEHCLHFKPEGRRRHWYVRMPDAASLKEWKGVFKVCSRPLWFLLLIPLVSFHRDRRSLSFGARAAPNCGANRVMLTPN
jgi:hypothetical protein